MTASDWNQRYKDGTDRWELGGPTPPLEAFLRSDPRAPQPADPVLVPGCGRGHEAALLAGLGHRAIGLDFSEEAIREARRLQGNGDQRLGWLQADLFDPTALTAAGLGSGSLQGVLEHTCFCAIDPARRPAYIATIHRLLAPGGWLLGLFWCHPRPDGPPWGSDPGPLGRQLAAGGFERQIWEPAQGSLAERDHEWLGLWRRSGS